MVIIANKPILYKVEASEISGPPENITAITKCPHCGKWHEHHYISSGDLRYCPDGWGRKKYRVILPQNEIPIAWARRAGDLTIIPRCPICQESHTHGRFAIGVMYAHCILHFMYDIQIVEGGK